MNEYVKIDEYIIKDPYIGNGIEKLISLIDMEYYTKITSKDMEDLLSSMNLKSLAKDPFRRVGMNVSMFNYHLINFYPDKFVSKIIKGPNFERAVKEKLFEILNVNHFDEDFPNNKPTVIGLQEDKKIRELYGLSKDSAVTGILLFNQPIRMYPFNRETGLYKGQNSFEDIAHYAFY